MRGIIWGKTQARANEFLLEMEQNYNRYGYKTVQKMIRQKHSYSYIIFDNNDCWRAVKTGDNARGHKCNISYIDATIDNPDDIMIAKHSTCSMPYHAYTFFNLTENYPWNKEEE